MASDVVVLDRKTLHQWLITLDKEYSVHGDNIHIVKKQIEDVLDNKHRPKTTESNSGLTFAQIKTNTLYRFRADSSTKSEFHGKLVKVIEKKRKNVVGLLEENTYKHKIGTRFNIPPSALEEVK